MEHVLKNGLAKGAASLFGLAVQARSAGYDRGLLPIHRIPGVTVISVGNLRAGGTGKTPLAMFLAHHFRSLGLPTALILRGYKGSRETGGALVSMGNGPLVSPEEAGDEAYMAALHLRDIQIRVGGDRVASCRSAAARGARVAVLDDGFQHRRVHRDLDILLICPEDLSPRTRLLPAGPLRELSAGATRADLTAGLAGDWIGSSNPPDLLFEPLPTHLVSGDQRRVPVGEHPGLRVHLVAGIARPERFESTARASGFDIRGRSFFSDHHRFSAPELGSAALQAHAEGAECLLTTCKDAARISSFDGAIPMWALDTQTKIIKGFQTLSSRLAPLLPLVK